jgi:hypothetical protein
MYHTEFAKWFLLKKYAKHPNFATWNLAAEKRIDIGKDEIL